MDDTMRSLKYYSVDIWARSSPQDQQNKYKSEWHLLEIFLNWYEFTRFYANVFIDDVVKCLEIREHKYLCISELDVYDLIS